MMKIKNKPLVSVSLALGSRGKSRSIERDQPPKRKRSTEGVTTPAELTSKLLGRIAGFAKAGKGSVERTTVRPSAALPNATRRITIAPKSFVAGFSIEEERSNGKSGAAQKSFAESRDLKASPIREANLNPRESTTCQRMRTSLLPESVHRHPARSLDKELLARTFYEKNPQKTESVADLARLREQQRPAKSTSPAVKLRPSDSSVLLNLADRKFKTTPFRQNPATQGSFKLNRKVGSSAAVERPPEPQFSSRLQAIFRNIQATKHARSIERREVPAQRKDLQSEDKYPRTHMVQQGTFHAGVSSSPRMSTCTPVQNKYLEYLMQSLKGRERAQGLMLDIAQTFKKWKVTKAPEFAGFSTQQYFYRVERRLGKGCFGEVLLAEQLLTEQRVALKKIPKTSIKSKDSQRKIDREVLILKRLNSLEGISKLLEVFEDEESVYLVFELLPNGDLVSYFKTHPLFEEQELKPFFRVIVETIRSMHTLGILHRDIKLDNILLDNNLTPKVCDFGISSIMEPGRRIYDTGGTPAYLAPEVILAAGDVGPKSDVWSLGVLLFLLTNGVVPFRAPDVQLLYQKIILGKYRLPSNHNCSSELEDLLSSMLVVDIEQRFSVDQVLSHRWFRDSSKNTSVNAQRKELRPFISEAVTEFMGHLGFPKAFIEQSLKKCVYNHVKACFDTLCAHLSTIDETILTSTLAPIS